MPRRERKEHVPESIAYRDFNACRGEKKRPATPTEDIDLLDVHQPFLFNLFGMPDIAACTFRLTVLLKDKTFTANGKTYKVVKVFSAGNGHIKIRCEVLLDPRSERDGTEAC